MGAKHKYAAATIDIQTWMPAHHLANLSMHIATFIEAPMTLAQLATYRITCDNYAPPTVCFAVRRFVRSRWGQPTLRFRIDIRATSFGAYARTGIDYFETLRQTVMFIPVMPKQLLGYRAYQLYMQALRDAVLREDPRAQVIIAERGFA